MRAEDFLKEPSHYELKKQDARYAEAFEEEHIACLAYQKAQAKRFLIYRELRDASWRNVKREIARARSEVRKRKGCIVVMRWDRQRVSWLHPLKEDGSRDIPNGHGAVALPCQYGGGEAWDCDGNFYVEVE